MLADLTNGAASAAQLRTVPCRDYYDAGAQAAGRLALDESRPVTSETTRFQCIPADQVLKAASEMAQRACAA